MDHSISPIRKYLFVSLGALPGAFLRWSINEDLLVNIFGALILGFVVGFDCHYRYKLILAIGFCGSFTTFSNWIIDSMDLILQGNLLQAIYSLLSSLFLGVLALLIAFYLGRRTKRLMLP